MPFRLLLVEPIQHILGALRKTNKIIVIDA
jgi:hypothetical protein